MKKIAFILETCAGLALLWAVNLVFFRQNPGFAGIAPHPYLYLVVLITLRYGYMRGLFSLLLAAASYLVTLAARGVPIDYPALSPVAIFIVFTTITGIVTDSYRKKIANTREQVSSLTSVSGQLKEERDRIEKKNHELSQRLMAEKSTFAILYRAARKLSTLDTEKLFEGIINLMDNVIEGENCAIFLLQGHKLGLKAARDRQALKGDLLDQELIEQVINEKKTFSIKDKLQKKEQVTDEVFLCGPLLHGSGGEAAGIILVQGLDFLKYNPTTVRTFTLICDWASICYENALLYRSGQAAGNLDQLATGLDEEFNGIFEYGADDIKIREYVDKVCRK